MLGKRACAVAATGATLALAMGLAWPASASAPGSEQTPGAPVEAPSAAASLAARAGALRVFGDAASLHFDSREQQVADGFFGRDNVRDSPELGRFLSQARQYVLVDGDRGITGWWNVFADAWIIGTWRREQTGWKLVSLTPLLGEDLTGPPPAAAAGGFDVSWPDTAATVAGALRTHDDSRVADFKAAATDGRLVALLGRRDESAQARVVLLMREAVLQRGLAKAEGEPGYQTYRARLQEALAQDSGAAADPVLAKALAGLSPIVRHSLVPVMAFRRADGLTFATQSPYGPGLIIVAHFATGPDGLARPVHYQFVSLFAGDAR